VIEHCWEPMTRFMQWRKASSRNGLGVAHGNQWGDWLAQGESTPLEYIDTIYFAITSRMMREMAAAIAREDESQAYGEQFAKIREAFQAEYFRADAGLTVDTQTAYALALFADLIPPPRRADTGRILAEMIRRNGNRMATGFLGTRPLLPVLSATGQHDLAVFLFQSREFPSWGYEVEQGATTIWERWDSYTKEDGFGRHNAAMNSFSHYAFGAVCEWMFRTLAGIESDGPGFRRIVIRPMPPSPGSNAEREPIHWVDASYESIVGRVASSWRVTGDRFELAVTVPANARATVHVPASDPDSVTEGGLPLDQSEGVTLRAMHDGRAVLSVEAGSYHFSSHGAIRPAAEARKILPPQEP
jgi:alpha-L-rhamnosidase